MSVDALIKNWGWIAIRGVAAIVFGILTFVRPGASLAALVLLFGVFAFADGVLNIVSAIRGRTGQPWWALVLGGVAGIVVGLVALSLPGLTAIALAFMVAAWAILTGVFQIAAAIRLRKQITGEGWLILGGLLSVAFGVVMAMAPVIGALVVTLWIGAYAILFGVLLLALAFRLRKHAGAHRPTDMPRVAPAH